MNTNIEIPFGAKDSEIKGWEYTIPADMEAVIEDGKVIVREKESEDERIRKALIDGVRQIRCKNGITQEQMLAYLERQKEQKPVDYAEELKKCKYNQLFFYDKYVKVKQKPSEKQDYSGLTGLERAIHRGFLAAGVENVPVTIIKETAEDCLANMNPAEWSERDEAFLDSIEDAISSYHDLNHAPQYHYWLEEKFKSLPPHQKIKWNESDIRAFNLAISIINGKPISRNGDDLQECITRLKWIRDNYKPQPNWKPSEEQMKILRKYVMGEWRDLTIGQDKILTSLYIDLEKL